MSGTINTNDLNIQIAPITVKTKPAFFGFPMFSFSCSIIIFTSEVEFLNFILYKQI